MIKYILIFMSHFNFDIVCDELIEYKSDVHKNYDIMIPDDYIEEIKKMSENNFSKFSNFQTYPDNWGCHNKEIVSFVFNNRYCELSELFGDNMNHLSIRIYPSR